MVKKAFKVDTETLALIDSYLKRNPEGQQKIVTAITKSIVALTTADSGKHLMFDSQNTSVMVKPKKEFRSVLKKKLGKGPYQVTKTVKSFTHVSDGFYILENCDELYPISWFDELSCYDEPAFLSPFKLIVWGLMLFTCGYAVGILPLLYFLILI